MAVLTIDAQVAHRIATAEDATLAGMVRDWRVSLERWRWRAGRNPPHETDAYTLACAKMVERIEARLPVAVAELERRGVSESCQHPLYGQSAPPGARF